MRRTRAIHTLLFALGALLPLVPGAVATADEDEDDIVENEPHDDLDDDEESESPRRRRGRRHDYSHFSDGPRRVPNPRGASQARAESLGLGTRDAASHALRRSPDPRWLRAAEHHGPMPEHLHWPVDLGRFGRGFGFVRRTRPDLRHDGVDVVADEGSVIRAVGPGIVAYSDNGIRGFGNAVVIVHPNGWVSLYAHCYRTTVQPGWRVRAGERIGFVGTTGISRGPHLHFELRRNGRAFDPLHEFEGRPWIAAYRRWRDLRSSGQYEEPTAHIPENTPPERGLARPTRERRAAAEDVGQVAFLRKLIADGAGQDELEEVPGDHFSNLLWPLRGSARIVRRPRGVNLTTEPDTPIRAVADGLVVFTGEGLSGVGKAVGVLHPNGWVTLYGNAESLHVEVGQAVQRGEWIARGGGAGPVHFQLHQGGSEVDPRELFVQVR